MNEPVVVRKLVGIEPNGTLRLDVARRTAVRTDVARAAAPTVVPADWATVQAPADATSLADDGPVAVAAGDRYATLGTVGAGAMGEVLLAQDRQLMRKVAFKRILESLAGNRSVAARFFAEAQVTAQLDHPNVVPIYDVDVPDGGPLGYAMKLVMGKTLTELIAEARLRVDRGDVAGERVGLTERLDWFLRVCDAIAHAHDKGVLHRDLKPDNIMIGGRGEVYVMDWGICRLIGLDGDSDEAEIEVGAGSVHGGTQYGAIIGTPAYMSPEQAQGRVPELDRRSDLYSLGLILAELVTLVPAIGGATLEQTLARASSGETRELRHHSRRVRVARELGGIIERATATDRDQRYPDVAALADDVRAYLRGDAVTASPDNPLQAAGRRLMRHKLAVFSVVAVLLLAAAAAVIAVLVHKERALTAAGQREHEVQAFILASSRRAHQLDSHFYRFQEALAGAAGRSESVVSRRGAPGPASSGDDSAAVYLSADFDDGDRNPADARPSPRYHGRTSIDAPVFVAAPGQRGADDAAVRAALAGLLGLHPVLEQLLVGTADDRVRILDREALREQILGDGVAVLRSFVTLADGTHVAYPGTGGYPPDFDDRKRAGYVATGQRGDVVWGTPYRDDSTHQLVLTASLAIVDASGERLGAAGLDLTFDWVASNLLELKGADYVESSYLVDGAGNVVINAGKVEGIGAADPTDSNMALEPLPIPAVRALLAKRTSGHLELEDEGRSKLVSFYPLDSLGWSYVVVADEETLVGR